MMFVSAKQSKTAAILAFSMFSGALLVQDKSASALKDAEDGYLKLLQEQTESFANRRAEKQRIDFLDSHRELFHRLDRYKEIDPTRKAVLKDLSTVVEKEGLAHVSYEFLTPQQRHDFTSKTQLVTDSLRLKGVTSNILDFNRAMNQLEGYEPNFYELFRCSIQRALDGNYELEFDCVLRWNLLISLRT